MAFNRETVSGFTPHLFIGIGRTCAFYTLRETYLHEVFIRGEGPMGGAVVNGVYQGTVHREVRSFHHFNLSQDIDEAFEKAEIAARQMGLELRATRDGMREEMREIKRRDADQMHAARVAAAMEANYRVDVFADRWTMDDLTQVHRNTFRFGKHAGKTFAEVNEFDRDYLEFMAKDDGRFLSPADELRRLALETFLEIHPAGGIPEIDDYFGEIGTRYEMTLTVKNIIPIQSDYGTSLLLKMVDEAGHRFTSFYSGNALDPKAGDTLRVKATVKNHEEYRGTSSTIINRIAEVRS